MKNINCYFLTETVQDDDTTVFSCKILHAANCNGCKWAKTYIEFNPRKVEEDIARHTASKVAAGEWVNGENN